MKNKICHGAGVVTGGQKNACHHAVNDHYNKIYSRLRNTRIFSDILLDTMRDDAPDLPGQYSFLSRRELRMIHEVLKNQSSAPIGLDLGCGLGGLTAALARAFDGSWVGLDRSLSAIETAQRKHASNKSSFICAHMCDTPFMRATFDSVLCIDTTQHASSYVDLSRELHRIIKPGGTIIFTNWMRQLPKAELASTDPLLSALLKNYFRLEALVETDPGVRMQLQVYRRVYELRKEIELAMGQDFLDSLLAEAKHLIERRKDVSRYLTVLRR